MRIKLDSEVSIVGGATKTITVYAPQGFRVVAPTFDLLGSPGDLVLQTSKSTMASTWIDEGMSHFPLADGSTAKTIPTEGWIFKVKNTTGGNLVAVVGLVCEEGEIVTQHLYNGGTYPATVV